MASPDSTAGTPPRLTLPPGDPVAAALVEAIHGGDLDALRHLLSGRPALASVHMVSRHGLETPGGSIGTPLDSALGKLPRLEELLAATPPSAEARNEAFWPACHGGQRRTAERLVAANLNASPTYANNESDLDATCAPDPRRDLLANWLREEGATGSSAG